mmetsp:Transcript_44060/g.115789  ORF Transcript_44060/g.115789 Transcript_44060/m.115789 type:complete len:295 (-) Transcript_44060:1454-2338(-)
MRHVCRPLLHGPLSLRPLSTLLRSVGPRCAMGFHRHLAGIGPAAAMESVWPAATEHAGGGTAGGLRVRADPHVHARRRRILERCHHHRVDVALYDDCDRRAAVAAAAARALRGHAGHDGRQDGGHPLNRLHRRPRAPEVVPCHRYRSGARAHAHRSAVHAEGQRAGATSHFARWQGGPAGAGGRARALASGRSQAPRPPPIYGPRRRASHAAPRVLTADLLRHDGLPRMRLCRPVPRESRGDSPGCQDIFLVASATVLRGRPLPRPVGRESSSLLCDSPLLPHIRALPSHSEDH